MTIAEKVLKSVDSKPAQAPISAHPLFGPLVALWFATLFGMGSFVLPSSLYEPLLGSPLGLGKRLLLALVMAAVGAALGLWAARTISRRASNRSAPERPASTTRRRLRAARPPLSVHDEMDDDPLPRPASATSPLAALPDLPPHRPLASADQMPQDEAPVPAIAAEESDPTPALTPDPQIGTSEPLTAEPAADGPGEQSSPQAQPLTGTPADDVWPRSAASAQDREHTAAPGPAPGIADQEEPANSALLLAVGEPAAPAAADTPPPIVPPLQGPADVTPAEPPRQAPETTAEAGIASDAETATGATAAAYTASRPYTERALDQLSVAELVERLAHAMYAPQAQAHRPAPTATYPTAPAAVAEASFASTFRPLAAFDQSIPQTQDGDAKALQDTSVAEAYDAGDEQREPAPFRRDSAVTAIAKQRRNRAGLPSGTTEQALRAVLASLDRNGGGTA